MSYQTLYQVSYIDFIHNPISYAFLLGLLILIFIWTPIFSWLIRTIYVVRIVRPEPERDTEEARQIIRSKQASRPIPDYLSRPDRTYDNAAADAYVGMVRVMATLSMGLVTVVLFNVLHTADFMRLLNDYNNGKCRITEGKMTEFSSGPCANNPSYSCGSFVVNGTSFSFSDAPGGIGFHQSYDDTSTLKDGVTVKVWANDNAVARLDIAIKK